MNLSRFQIHPIPIDEGTFGVALKAFDTVENRNICLKMIKSDLFEEFKEYTFREIEMLQKLDHPNIVKCFGSFNEDEKFYIVLEYIEKGDLKSYLKKNNPPLPEEIVLSFFSQMVSGLSYAHSFKIIHRDLKPGNILLTKDDKIKIIDFNSAKVVSTICPEASTQAGTRMYMPPEIISDQNHSFPADVWSLGCIIYELMTGRPPFLSSNEAKLAEMILNQNPDSIEGNYSSILTFIVLRMLEKNPNDRITLKEIQNFLPSANQKQEKIQNFEKEKSQIQNLEREKSQLQTENQNLKKENSQLRTDKQDLEKVNFRLLTDLKQLEDKVKQLSNQNLGSQSKIQNLEKSNSLPGPIQNPPIYSDQQIIEQWIEKRKWTLLYKATRDGFKAKDFHSKCDNQGSTVTIITSKEGHRFGGYAHLSWNSSGLHVQDSSKQSFIFTLTNPHNIPPTKYPLTEQKYAIYCGSDRGPCFGGIHGYADINVSNQSNQNTKSFANFPDSYSDTTGKANKTFTGNKNFSTQEIEIFKVSD